MADPVAVVVAARDEEDRITATVAALRAQFPDAGVVVADDGSRDATADRAEAAGAVALRLPRRGKGQALSAGERAAAPGPLLLCDADLEGDLGVLREAEGDVVVARFAQRQAGGFGFVKLLARHLVRARCGYDAREPLSGQRLLTVPARAACFPLAPGFGCEVRMTVDAARAGLRVDEVEVSLAHRPTGRDVRGFVHRGRQLVDILLALGPLAVNHRGARLPLVGWLFALRHDPAVALVALVGAADDARGGLERGFRAHLVRRRTTGVLKLVAIPAIGLAATRRLSGGLLVGLAANAVNQLDTRPGRALKAYLALAVLLRAPTRLAVLLLPYDLQERTMLGDAGSNALGALLGLRSVGRLTERGRWLAIGALSGLTLLGELRSLGALIERTPVLRQLDSLGRSA